MATEKKPARWLADKDGDVRLFAGDDVEAARGQGWTDPVGSKSNGEPWNPEPVEGEQSQADAAAALGKLNAEHRAKVAARKDKEAQAANKSSGEAEAPPRKADMLVEIVEPEKPAKGKK